MPVYKRTKMCSECPFRQNSVRGWLGPLTVDDLEDCVHGPKVGGHHIGDIGELICHVDISRLISRGLDEDDISQLGQCCVGMIRYANQVCKRSHNREVSDFQDRVRTVPDEPIIPPWKLRENHTIKPSRKSAKRSINTLFTKDK